MRVSDYLYYLGNVLNLPAPLRAGVLLLGGASLMTVVWLAFGSSREFFVIFIGILCVGLLLALYKSLLDWRRKRKAAPFEQKVLDQAGATPQGISAPVSRARLDDLRKKFDSGLDRFRAVGKDLYSLPWYVLVGEPGSGKTEAIRHSSVGFPPGLQDELQGVGGTINMNWWFTNHAVILDTAGRLMFEEVEPGSTSEWQEFLRLLRTHRPNCPINGMLLVIPADSLIRDTADAIQRKAAKIARQLDQIQRVLDVRFPVFVVVTKCDLINGFREFFDNITDPQLQHQMLGWSNPAPLDEPFNPELVNQHLSTVRQRLERRRLALLLDPVHTEAPDRNRLEQVDALYAFPQSLEPLVPRLQRYLQMIFVAGTWSNKPLFLRGIYFTSSMREGSALDTELAEALGVPVESLPEGRVWERDRAYFLRDLFMEKVFREKGLVTRASSTRGQKRRRRAVLLTAGFLSVALLGFLTWLGVHTLRQGLGAQAEYWMAAAGREVDERRPENWTPEGFWRPLVAPEFQGSLRYEYRGNDVLEVAGQELGTVDFCQKLHALTDQSLDIPWVFRVAQFLTSDVSHKRTQAMRVLFEQGVLRPLVEATRAAMTREQTQPPTWSPQATRALAQLIRLERQALGLPDPSPPPARRTKVPARRPPPETLQPEADDVEEDGAGVEDQSPPAVRPAKKKTPARKPPSRQSRPEAAAKTPLETPPSASRRPAPDVKPAKVDLGAWTCYVVRPEVGTTVPALPDQAGSSAGCRTYRSRHQRLVNPLLAWVYAADGAAAQWPPVCVVGTGSPPAKDAIRHGVECFIAYCRTLVDKPDSQLHQIDSLLALFSDYDDHEARLLELDDKYAPDYVKPTSLQEFQAVKALWDSRLAALRQQKNRIEAALAFLGPDDSLAGCRERAIRDVLSRLRREYDRLLVETGVARPADDEDAEPANIVAEVDVRLRESLEEIEKSLRDAKIDEAVKRLDAQFLLMLRQLGRLYAVRFRMYESADASLQAKDTIPRLSDVRAALADVAQQVDRTQAEVRQLLEVDPRAYRFQQAADLASFVLRLALRSRNYHLLRGVLERVPQTADEVQRQITEQATGASRPARPTVVLTRMDASAGPFAPAFDADSMAAVISGWTAVEAILKDEKLQVLDRDDLKALYERLRQVCNEYAAKYVEYWTKTVPADLAIVDRPWTEFYQRLAALPPEEAHAGLQDLMQRMDRALAALGDIQGLPFAEAVKQMRDQLDRGAKRLQRSSFTVECRDAVGSWVRLGNDPGKARDTVLAMTPGEFLRQYMIFPDRDADLVAAYWEELTYMVLHALANEAQHVARQALDELARKYSRFPLARPRAGQPELTPAEVDQARAILMRVFGWQFAAAAPGSAAATIGQGAQALERPRVEKELARLRKPSLPDERDQQWIDRLGRLLAALPTQGQQFSCSIRALPKEFVGAQGTPVQGIWNGAYCEQAQKGLTKQIIGESAAVPLGAVLYPDGDVNLGLYRYPDDVDKDKVDRTRSFTGLWACLRLLHEAEETRRTRPDGCLWQVKWTEADSEQNPRSLWLELEFPEHQGLPAITDWPDRIAAP